MGNNDNDNNKWFKLLTTWVFSVAVVVGLACVKTYATAKYDVIPSPTGNVLKLYDVKEGKLYDEFEEVFVKAYVSREEIKHIVISGNMNDNDFGDLSSLKGYCEYAISINLLDVKTDKIPDGSFVEERYLETFICPKNLKFIGKDAFAGCYKLKTVVLPQSLEIIEPGCFSFCKNLELTVSTTIKIGKNAFKRSPKIKFAISNPLPQSDSKSMFSMFRSLLAFII